MLLALRLEVDEGGGAAPGAAARAARVTAASLRRPLQISAVVLRVLDGRSEAETANLLGCSTGTVKSNLARGLAKVRGCLSQVACAEGERA